MKHRIRAASLIVQDGRILLVQHVHPRTGEIWWVPPGGGLEPVDNSVFDCARRETFEETGLTVDLERIVYIREFKDAEFGSFNLELFILARNHNGTLTIGNVQGNGPDEHYIKDVQWLDRQALQARTVYPEILQSDFWNDLAHGFPQLRYLGRASNLPAAGGSFANGLK